MKLHMEIAIASALLGAGCAAASLGVWRALRRTRQRQQDAERHIAALTATVRALEIRITEMARAVQPVRDVESLTAAAEGADVISLKQPRPETLAVLTAAATAFLGKAATVRSARLIPTGAETVSPWSQQGRVIVQTSHNLRPHE